ncbi:MAG: DUF2236 domain-containing protein [Thalassolituus maritimus]|nr:MAG: DUF2236 domain-containing protein [Thalassolituus maritimus]
MNTPERHGIHIHTARKIASPILLTIKDQAAAEPNSVEWQELGQQLLCGDPLADDVAAWLATSEGQWSVIEYALKGSMADVSSLPPELQAFVQHAHQLPDWLNEEALSRGCAVVARSGKTGMRILRDFGLMAGYQASAINQALLKTGALGKGAQRRVAETTKWWMDCTEPGSVLPGGQGFVTTLRVRLIHAMVRRQLSVRKDWDHDYLGLPVNQLDMQVTYLAFSVMFLLGQRVLGVIVSKEEGSDVMHLWRYIGWLMGLDESLLVDNEQDGRIALYRNLLSQAQADEGSKQLAQALMNEPLERYYPSFQKLRGHWDKEVHLSIIRLFIGSQGMRALGLPACRLPWYPLLFMPLNATFHTVIRLIPGGKTWLSRRGRRAQNQMLAVLFGQHKPRIIQVAETQ